MLATKNKSPDFHFIYLQKRNLLQINQRVVQNIRFLLVFYNLIPTIESDICKIKSTIKQIIFKIESEIVQISHLFFLEKVKINIFEHKVVKSFKQKLLLHKKIQPQRIEGVCFNINCLKFERDVFNIHQKLRNRRRKHHFAFKFAKI